MTVGGAILSLLLPLLFWASFVALLCIRDWIASRAPAAQKAEALIREWLSPGQLREYKKNIRKGGSSRSLARRVVAISSALAISAT